MKTTRRFWPLDYDPEVEIYENLSWDLPGFKRFGKRTAKTVAPSRQPKGRQPRAGHIFTRSAVTFIALSSQ